MMAYNKNELENTFNAQEIEDMRKEGLITLEISNELLSKLFSRYRSNPLFIRIGVFILTLIVASSGLGIMGVALAGLAEAYGLFVIIGSLALFFALNQFAIKSQKFFRGGMDEALLYYAISMLFSGIMILFETYDHFGILGHCIILLPILLVGVVLYVDGLLAILSFIVLGLIIFYSALELGVWGKSLMPFMMMAYAVVIWKLTTKLEANAKLFVWTHCIVWVKWASMILLALAGNYFVVRELGSMLLETPLAIDQEIPLSWVFYIYTYIVPLGYIFWGLKDKNLGLLNIGLVFVVVAVSTIQYYYPLDIEWLLVFGGISLGVVSYIALKYWKEDKHGITVKAHAYHQADSTKLEATIIQQTLSQDPPPEKLFGGGSFGGGGTGGSF